MEIGRGQRLPSAIRSSGSRSIGAAVLVLAAVGAEPSLAQNATFEPIWSINIPGAGLGGGTRPFWIRSATFAGDGSTLIALRASRDSDTPYEILVGSADRTAEPVADLDLEVGPVELLPSDRGFWMVGYSIGSRSVFLGPHAARVDLAVVEVSVDGAVLVDRSFGPTDLRVVSDVEALPGESFVVAGHLGYENVFIARFGADGERLWEHDLGPGRNPRLARFANGLIGLISNDGGRAGLDLSYRVLDEDGVVLHHNVLVPDFSYGDFNNGSGGLGIVTDGDTAYIAAEWSMIRYRPMEIFRVDSTGDIAWRTRLTKRERNDNHLPCYPTIVVTDRLAVLCAGDRDIYSADAGDGVFAEGKLSFPGCMDRTNFVTLAMTYEPDRDEPLFFAYTERSSGYYDICSSLGRLRFD